MKCAFLGTAWELTFGKLQKNNMWDSIKKPLLLIVFVFICLFLFVKLAGPIPFFINSVTTTKQDVFQVDGTGTATAVPDIATISFGVTKGASTVAAAQNQTNTAIKNILAALSKMGVADKDIQTTNYSVNPTYAVDQTIQGYTVTQNATVKLSQLEKVNQAIDMLTVQGANLVGQVSFGFSDSVKQNLENDARKMAVAHAKEKAQSLANAAGIHLGSIINVTENSNSVPQPITFDAMKGSANQIPTTITPGENEINLTITLSYQTY